MSFNRENKMKLTLTTEIDKEVRDFLEHGLEEYNQKILGEGRNYFYVTARDNDALMGGAKSFSLGMHCFISWLYVDERARGQGLGRKIMDQIEGEARG
jgi:GNAT superfamily N-acetyltransferase